MSLSAKLFLVLVVGCTGGYFAYGGAFAYFKANQARSYTGQYHLTVVKQGAIHPVLLGGDTGGFMRSDLIQLAPVKGGHIQTLLAIVDADLKAGATGPDVLQDRRGSIIPVDAVGGASYWHGLAIAAGIIAGIIAASLAAFGIYMLWGFAPQRSRLATCG